MKINLKTLILCSLLLLLTNACSRKNEIGSYYTSEPTCLQENSDGSRTIKVWGTGYNKNEAIQQAQKNAIYTILFDGIRKGNCLINPLVPEVNAEKKYSAFFSNFFENKGAYSAFVTEKTKGEKRIEQKNNSQVKIGIEVIVDINQLKKELINNNIIK